MQTKTLALMCIAAATGELFVEETRAKGPSKNLPDGQYGKEKVTHSVRVRAEAHCASFVLRDGTIFDLESFTPLMRAYKQGKHVLVLLDARPSPFASAAAEAAKESDVAFIRCPVDVDHEAVRRYFDRATWALAERNITTKAADTSESYQWRRERQDRQANRIQALAEGREAYQLFFKVKWPPLNAAISKEKREALATRATKKAVETGAAVPSFVGE